MCVDEIEAPGHDVFNVPLGLVCSRRETLPRSGLPPVWSLVALGSSSAAVPVARPRLAAPAEYK